MVVAVLTILQPEASSIELVVTVESDAHDTAVHHRVGGERKAAVTCQQVGIAAGITVAIHHHVVEIAGGVFLHSKVRPRQLYCLKR